MRSDGIYSRGHMLNVVRDAAKTAEFLGQPELAKQYRADLAGTSLVWADPATVERRVNAQIDAALKAKGYSHDSSFDR